MILNLNIITNLRDVTLEYLEGKLPDGRKVTLTWDESIIYRNTCAHKLDQLHCFKGITIRYDDADEEVYTNGKLEELENIEFTNCEIYSEQDNDDSDIFLIRTIEFIDDTHERDMTIKIIGTNLLYTQGVKLDCDLINLWEAIAANVFPTDLMNIISRDVYKLIGDSLAEYSDR